MRDLFKILLVGVVLFFAPFAFAGDYKLLILPDNIVTDNVSVDSFIYDAASEFFADEIATILNTTDNIKSQSVSEIRAKLKSTPSAMLSAKELTNRFRTSYNVDYEAAKKLAKLTGNRYVLLLTSTLDAENYILRRTWWDFFNIPGASVVDPAYKINTYAVLVDTQSNQKLWADTYYKTISVVENRIITRGPSPQTEQLAKIKDYSHWICPQIAQNVQISMLPPDVLAHESTLIEYDFGNIDNVFTKKYRGYRTGSQNFYNKSKKSTAEFREERRVKRNERKIQKAEKQAEEQKAKLEVKAQPVYEEAIKLNKIDSVSSGDDSKLIKSTVYKTEGSGDQSLFDPIEIKKTRRNNLFGGYNSDKPDLRDYSKL